MKVLVTRMFNAFLKDMNMKQKLLLSYLVLIVIPLGILAFLTYNRSSVILSDKMLDISSQSLDQLKSTLSYSLQSAVRSSNMVFSNKNVQDILLRDPKKYDLNTQYDDSVFLSDYFTRIQTEQSIYRIRLYMKEPTIYSNESINFFNYKSIQDSVFYTNAAERNGQIYITSPYSFKYAGINDNQEIISAIRVVNNPNLYGEFIGLVSVDILLRDITQIVTNSTLAKSSFILLANSHNQIITSSDHTMANEKYKDIGNMPIPAGEDELWQKTRLNNEDVMTASVDVPFSDWKLYAVMPMSTLLSANNELRNYTFVLMLIIGVIGYLLALLISGSMVKRLLRLMKVMKVAETGDLSVKVTISGKDEIGVLEERFSNMLLKIEDLVDEKIRIEKESKNAELRALQAQINPHFLYNTLELVTCQAVKYKADDITNLINLLARFYRLSLSNGKDIISIADELAHIETYIKIQNQRFDNVIQLELDIDSRILGYSIFKLILQPIVENAILHGIMEKDDQTGKIKISGRLEDPGLLLTVEDDGVGMEPEQLMKILSDEPRTNGHGFGILNVNKRLMMNYGEDYGLTIKSEKSVGTVVEIKIPAIQYER
ncbi:sensor histidine kinase [Paenibacillus koleovorans]|uniref:sensor histidine kinase n=1 Tax=Paenibacillus koleovorans TaxID=121608 RepID=UPI0013E3DB75|nr:sensor histidine kinase [Paenibacillus koleovorans]